MSVAAPAPAPTTATGTRRGNVDGQAIAITVFSAVKWWGRAVLPVVFLAPKVAPKTLTTLQRLSFIHYARWSLVTEIPHNGAPQPEVRLRYPHLYFESNFNGGWEEYIDAFSHVLTRGMWTFWGSSYGFPSALPTAPFKAYIKRNEMEASHYYSAYPASTTTQVRHALELDPMVAELRERAAGMDPDQFAVAFRELMARAQRCC